MPIYFAEYHGAHGLSFSGVLSKVHVSIHDFFVSKWRESRNKKDKRENEDRLRDRIGFFYGDHDDIIYYYLDLLCCEKFHNQFAELPVDTTYAPCLKVDFPIFFDEQMSSLSAKLGVGYACDMYFSEDEHRHLLKIHVFTDSLRRRVEYIIQAEVPITSPESVLNVTEQIDAYKNAMERYTTHPDEYEEETDQDMSSLPANLLVAAEIKKKIPSPPPPPLPDLGDWRALYKTWLSDRSDRMSILLHSYYTRFNPDKITEIPGLLEKYKDKGEELLTILLVKKYGRIDDDVPVKCKREATDLVVPSTANDSGLRPTSFVSFLPPSATGNIPKKAKK